MTTYRVIYSDSVKNTIKEATRYIARDSPANAERWLHQVLRAINRLEEFPHRCPPDPSSDRSGQEQRRLILGNYLATFTIREDTKTVYITSCRHSARQPEP